METISIIVATHKKMNYVLPSIYKLCQVNASIVGRWDNYYHDDDHEDNISKKNYCYCELTAQYDLWKNNNSEIKGLAHYRRFFSCFDFPTYKQYINNRVPSENIDQSVITAAQIRSYLNEHDIILQWPVNSFHTSAYENLTKHVYPKDIEVLISVIEKEYPLYKDSLMYVLSRIGISYLNMLIARHEIFDQYSQWMFEILGKVEKRIDISNYDTQHKRIFGYLSEVLLNVYVEYHKLKVKYVGMTELLEISDNPKGIELIKKKYIPQTAKCLWKRIRTDDYLKYRYLIQLSSGKAKHRILADCYRNCNSFSDVYRLMRSFKDFDTSIQKINVGNNCVPYIKTVNHGIEKQSSKGGICIINIYVDSDIDINCIISKLYDLYSDTCTLDIRIINATNQSIKSIRDKSEKRCLVINK